jgi:hypothetical protein
MGFVDEIRYDPMVGDPDDHRPNTMWSLVLDSAAEDRPYVQDVTRLFERVAPGDRIPLHTHSTQRGSDRRPGNGRVSAR